MKKRETHETHLEPRNTQDFNTKGETNKLKRDTKKTIQETNKTKQDTNRMKRDTSKTIQGTNRMKQDTNMAKQETHKTHINLRNKRDETKRESNQTNSWRHQCGATLITNKHFLTAGHCANKE